MRSGRLRLSLGKELRQIGAKRKLLNQERDRILTAIGARAQESGDAELASTDSQVISDAWSAVQRAQVAVDNALAEAATAEGMVKDQQSRLAAIRAEDRTTVAKFKCEYDAAANEAARLRLVVSIKTTASREVGQGTKRLQSEIASVANGKPNTRPVDVLVDEKAQLDARLLELTESLQKVTSEADAAKLVFKERRTVLAQANSAAAARATLARRELKASVRTYRTHARAVEAAKPALQIARKLLGQALCEQRPTVGCAAEFAGRWTETVSELSGLDGRMADARGQIKQLAPDVRQLVAAAVAVLVCAVSITCIVGNVIPKNTVEAYRRAAEKGDAKAQLALGAAYANGTGVGKDDVEAVRWYRRSAEQGDAVAQLLVGNCYNNGTGVAKDPKQAVAWYRRAAEQGDVGGCMLLADAYGTGRGVPKDDAESARWFAKAVEQANALRAQQSLGDTPSGGGEETEPEDVRGWRKAAERGDVRAQYNLGLAYANGRGVEKDEAEAVRWYRKAAEQGFDAAQLLLGLAYGIGFGVRQDDAEAVRWCRKAADQGYAEAQCAVGRAYFEGCGVEKNEAEAVRWSRKAAEQGSAEGQCALGVTYSLGKGVNMDNVQAVRWWRKAAEQGYAPAQCHLGVAYANGAGVEKDDVEAVRWWCKSAEQGSADAQCNLGVAYANGAGVEKDDVEAVRWYRKAAEQDSALAQCNLGAAYYGGNGVQQDDVEAVRWFRKAAEQGLAPAQWLLGAACFSGRGVEKDDVEAVAWFRKAADQGLAEDMALIPAGSFMMGDSLTESDGDELPVHSVNVGAFYMSKTEVTWFKWQVVRTWAAANGYDIGAVGAGKAPNHPVHSVNWYDCVKWLNARSQMEGKTACYAWRGVTYKSGQYNDVVCNWSADGYRLPTEAEWEKAARGGIPGKRFPWGDTINHDFANYRANSTAHAYDTSLYTTYTYHPVYDDAPQPYTSPVGSFAPNGYGIFDMSGNVWEWCWDWSEGYGTSQVTDPHGPASGSGRVARGGGWGNYGASSCRVSARGSSDPISRSIGNGFRVVLPSGQQ